MDREITKCDVNRDMCRDRGRPGPWVRDCQGVGNVGIGKYSGQTVGRIDHKNSQLPTYHEDWPTHSTHRQRCQKIRTHDVACLILNCK